MFSTMTMAPSTIMPKSSAPRESRLAGMWRRSRQREANRRENGMVRVTRYTYRRSFFSGYFTTGVKWLLIVNTAVFILMGLLSPQFTGDFMLLALAPVAVVKHFAIWQLATYLFLHGGVWHLVFNMLTLWMFGTPLERDWGTRRFLKYYFICGIGAGLCDVLLNAVIGNWHTSTIGASGAIYGLLLAFGVCYPEQTGQ